MTAETPSSAPRNDPFAAIRVRDFRWFALGNMCTMLGMQMQSMAVGWEIYEREHSNLAVGLVGLVQVLPVLCLGLPAGQVADWFDRRRLMMGTLACMATCSLGLTWISYTHGSVMWMYGLLLVHGIARAFYQPARASFMPQIVPRDKFRNAVTWNSSGFQLATVIGPMFGGLLIGLRNSATAVYVCDASLALAFVAVLATIASRQLEPITEGFSWSGFWMGLRFVYANKIMLSAITLDMFAVLLGGATMLLPVYAKDILHVGPAGYGWLRAAPGIGAVLMSVVLAMRPTFQRAGRTLIVVVFLFGLGTIAFGVSRSYMFSLAALLFLGAVDMISVVIRHTMVQLLTPDSMRGRVSAVNSIFIGASNELGGFESGLMAYFFERPGDPAFGPTVSVVSGGIGTLLVVALVTWAWPQLLRYRRLEGDPETAVTPAADPPAPPDPPPAPKY